MVFSIRFSSVLAAALLTLSGIPSQAAVLISDNFDTVVSGGNLHTRAPVVNTINSNAWSSTTSTLLGTGSGAITGDPSTFSHSGSIGLGTNFFANNPGQYRLSSQMAFPSAATGQGWLGIGFSSLSSTANNFVGNQGNPWLLYRANGSVVFFAGPSNTNSVTIGTFATGTAHNFSLEINHNGTSWLANVFIDGVQYDLNGTAAGMSYNLGTTPNASNFIGLATGTNGTTPTTGTFDNFVFEAVPEPGISMLLGMAFGVFCFRRKRSAYQVA